MPSVPFSRKPRANFSIKAIGSNAVISKFMSFTNRVIEPALFIGLKKSLLIIERESIRLINSGYYKPAVDTGHMRRNVTTRILYQTHREIAGAVGVVDTRYAIYVHEGVESLGMPERRFLVDAANNKGQEIINELKGIINNTVKFKKF